MQRRILLALSILIVLAAGWYIFRPERRFIDQKVAEEFPEAVAQNASSSDASSMIELKGSFHDVAHKGVGQATIYRLAGGRRVLRLTDFETSNGPDVRVYLVAADEATDNDTVTRAGFVDLGSLKGNIGNQNYDVPSELNLDKYRSVTIWCRRFSVNFATAPLMPQS